MRLSKPGCNHRMKNKRDRMEFQSEMEMFPVEISSPQKDGSCPVGWLTVVALFPLSGEPPEEVGAGPDVVFDHVFPLVDSRASDGFNGPFSSNE